MNIASSSTLHLVQDFTISISFNSTSFLRVKSDILESNMFRLALDNYERVQVFDGPLMGVQKLLRANCQTLP